MRVFNFFDVEFLGIRFFNVRHLRFVVLATGFQDRLDFRYGDYREIFSKQEETGEEQSEGSEIESNLPDGWRVIRTPARWQEIAVDRSNDDHETLVPHSDIHYDTHEERNRDVSSQFAAPEQLW